MKKRIGLFFIMILLAFMALPVYAISENGFYADDSVDLKKEIGATTFAAGNMINVSSKIDGMAFIAGNSVTVSSTQDHLFVAGNTVTLNGAYAKDIFAAGSSIVVSDTKVRDLFAAAGQVTVNSDVDRNAFLGGDKIVINSVIYGNLKVSCEELVFGEDAKVMGNLDYPDNIKEIPEGVVLGETKAYKSDDSIDVEVETKGILAATAIMRFIRKLCSMLLVGLLFLLLFKKFFINLEKEEQSAANFFKKFGIGFGVLFLLPIAAIILMITIIGLPISIISLLVYGVLIYLSAIPTSYYLGKWIFKDKLPNEYLLYIVSIIILYVINRLPIIGGLTSFISLCVGLGFFVTAIINATKSSKEEKKK